MKRRRNKKKMKRWRRRRKRRRSENEVRGRHETRKDVEARICCGVMTLDDGW